MSKGQVERLKARLHDKAEHVQAFMNSEIGKAVIEALTEQFHEGEIFDPDPHVTAYRCGQRDVVTYIKQLSRFNRDTKDGTT